MFICYRFLFDVGVAVFFFKQNTAYEMRISDWSSDVCSSDLLVNAVGYLCEAAWHHADLAVTWGKLWVKLTTHSSGGITDKDLDRKSVVSGKSVSVRVDIGGRRII